MTWQSVMKEMLGAGGGSGVGSLIGTHEQEELPAEEEEETPPVRKPISLKDFFVPAPQQVPQGSSYYGPNEESLSNTAGKSAGRGIGALLQRI